MNIINKKSIMYLSIGSLILSGCSASNDVTPQAQAITTKMVQAQPLQIKASPSSSSWKEKSLPMGKIDKDCIDCYAKPVVQDAPQLNRTYYAQVNTNVAKSIGGYKFVETDADRKVKSDYSTNSSIPNTKLSTSNTPTYSSHGSYPDYSTKGLRAIQVGAFRNYSGAKSYLERYNRFGKKYKVGIKTGTKNNKPIHRVQIVGFKNASEAESFMNRNGLSDAFLVK